jgi:transglutaminase-like putative cysteine protease
VTRAEQGVQTVEETLTASCGSCRDTAWLLVQVVRNLGLAARFVSGYLIQLKPDVAPPGASGVPAQDSASLHAWTEVYIPGAGWIGFDPTSGLLCGEGHLPLAASPHFTSAAPVSGSVSSAEASFSFQMQLTRVGATASDISVRQAP